MTDVSQAQTALRTPLSGAERLRAVVESAHARRFIIAVIVLNAAVIGLETSETAMKVAGGLLRALDIAALAVFVTEISLKLFVYRARFFRDGWNFFDFIIVAISLAPAGQTFSVLRALRILRTLRLISAVRSMRVVTQALLHAIPGMGSIVALLALVFYVCSVMATKFFGADFEAWFGTIGRSAFTLFQIMTLESWSMGVVRPVLEVYPWAWAFFVPFILIVTFAVLNLFIALIVNSMHDAHTAEMAAEASAHDRNLAALTEEIAALRGQVAALAAAQERAPPAAVGTTQESAAQPRRKWRRRGGKAGSAASGRD